MKKSIQCATLLSFFLFSSLISFGQSNDSLTSNKWMVELGYQNFRTLDKNVSPLLYIAHNGAFSFQFQKLKPKSFWAIGANISIGSNQSKRFGKRTAITHDHYDVNGNRDSTVYEVNPSLSFIKTSLYYLYYWKLKPTKIKMFAGGGVQNDFYYGALGADVWFFNQLSIMPAFIMSTTYNSKSSVDFGLSIPIFSYLVRQPYTLDPSLPENSYFKANLQTGSTFATINMIQQLNIKVKYNYKLKKSNKIGVSYNFMWMNYVNIPNRNLRAYANSVQISYTF